MGTTAGLNLQIGANVQQLNAGLNSATTSLTNFSNSVNRLTPVTAAATAGVTNLSNAVNQGQASFTGMGNAAQRASGQFVQVGNALNLMSRRDLQTFNIQARSGQLSYVGLGGAATSAGRAISSTTRPTAQAATTLSNLGRIASDAPFGFIAIQNNLDPLIDSFVRLRATAGSNGAALKALFSSLAGPAGIAIGFTIVTAAATKLIQQYGSLGNAFTALNPFVDKQVKLQLQLSKAMLEGGKNAQEEITHVDTLYRATQNLTIPLAERNKIVDELQKKYPSYFGNLTNEAILAGNAAKAYDSLKESLLNTATIKAAEGVLVKTRQNLFEVRDAIKEVDKDLEELRKPGSGGFFDSNIEDVSRKISAAQNKRNGLLAKERDILKEEDKLLSNVGASIKKASDLGIDGPQKVTDVIRKLNEELKAVDDKSALFNLSKGKFSSEKVTALNKAFEDLSKINTDEARAEMKKIANQITSLEAVGSSFKSGVKISDIITDLNARLAAAEGQAKGTGASLDVLAKDKIQLLQSAFERLVNLGLKPTSPELKKIQKQIVDLGDSIIGIKPIDTKQLQDIGKNVRIEQRKNLTAEEVRKILGVPNDSKLMLDVKATPNVTYNEAPALISLSKFAEKFKKKSGEAATDAATEFSKKFTVIGNALSNALEPVIVDIQKAIAGVLADVTSSIAEAIGNIVNGRDSLGATLGGILRTIGSFIADFGKALITAATLKIIAEKSLIANPYLALAAGAAAVIAGAALKNKVPSFATGGVVTEPTLAMVGDNPGKKEAIIPSELWDKIGGGGAGIAFVDFDYDRLRIRIEQSRRRGGF